MGKNYDYEYIIIGSGPAGRTTASLLAKAKKSVAIVEDRLFGGSELNTRDYPYRYCLNFAKTYHDFRSSPAVNGSSCHFNLPALISNLDREISSIEMLYRQELANLGITMLNGFASFLDPHTIAVNDRRLTAHHFILATGAEPKFTGISGLDAVKYYDPENALRMRQLPRFVFVVGGGPTGVQIAEYFAMLGVGVIIMEVGDHILPREDEEVAAAITNYFTDELGITVVPNAKVIALSEDYTSKIVVFTDGTGEKMVRVDAIVLATGSAPFLDYGLENAGVAYKHTGIITDKYFSTSTKNIYAIGDSIGVDESSSERAKLQARILANNLLHRQKLTPGYEALTRHIHLQPAVAVIGLNEQDALKRDLKYKKSIIYLNQITTLNSPEYKYGFVKLLANHSGRIIGATVVSPSAELVVSELSLALSHHQSVETLASTPHPEDTPAAAIALAAKKLLTK